MFNVVYLWFGVYVFVCNVFVLNGFVMCAYEISCLQLCSCVVWRICFLFVILVFLMVCYVCAWLCSMVCVRVCFNNASVFVFVSFCLCSILSV